MDKRKPHISEIPILGKLNIPTETLDLRKLAYLSLLLVFCFNESLPLVRADMVKLNLFLTYRISCICSGQEIGICPWYALSFLCRLIDFGNCFFSFFSCLSKR